MAFENSAGIGVSNHYGVRSTGQTSGKVKTEGSKNQFSVQVDAKDIGVALYQAPELPAGALVTGVFARVSEAFALGGTTPVIDIGTSGSESANGANLTEAQAEAVGLYDITGTIGGTWASMLAADTALAVVLGGTAPTKTAAGKLEIIIEYVFVTV